MLFRSTSADGEKLLAPDCKASPSKQPAPDPAPEPVVREKVYFNKKPLPKPAPPPPQPHTPWGNGEAEESSTTRMPPVGMSHQAVKRGEPGSPSSPVEVCRLRSTLRDRCLNRDALRATVTLQQPLELNGEDELVFTVVEELSIGGLGDGGGRPTSIVSFSSDCSLRALASGSRPVSIISSINDEFDAYTASFGGSEVAAAGTLLGEDVFVSVGSGGSSVSSWLSGVSVSTQGSEGGEGGAHSSSDVFLPHSAHAVSEGTFYLDSFGLFQCEPLPRDAKNSQIGRAHV